MTVFGGKRIENREKEREREREREDIRRLTADSSAALRNDKQKRSSDAGCD
jgi:hypothetical protein